MNTPLSRTTAALAAMVLTVVLASGCLGDDTTLVRGVIGSEKQAFFDDPDVRAAFAKHGLRVEVDALGSRQIATEADPDKVDFAFPGGGPAAERIQRAHGITAKHAPFSSPMAVASFKPIVDLLTRRDITRREDDGTWTLDVQRYLDLVRDGVRWDQIEDNATYPVRKNILITTTDPRTSNSAAMLVAVASYVANGDTVVQDAERADRTLPLLSKLFLGQGYAENTAEGPFEDYLSSGMGKTPLLWIYEAQFVDRAVGGHIRPDMVLLYPSPTVLSKHTLVPFSPDGDRVGELLTSDTELRRLAVRRGFRTPDQARFARIAGEHDVAVRRDLLNVADLPSYEMLERLLTGVERGYS